MKDEYKKYYKELKNYFSVEYPFITAHELAEMHKFESTATATAILKAFEKESLISSKQIKAGRGTVKVYFDMEW